ncbi:DNA cytosine methyltransferase [Catenibacterium mitsuokai]|uniref:DNA cytosine methyltransferase n=1 Tax=Catenibacterium mitsuokai TaxID=100886 RepID=UPI001C22AF27|nr:DNA (cytosine-5-)-methyltransferase [Catenibacterium mitsuokai]MBU9057307.1 DNA (cytosine-5-)-methyltransferase [Catenibacterium mitsuokai]MCB5428001.1 DNA (cytosine-5-)-methyltransferase [Catenibacterium mitsuokai]
MELTVVELFAGVGGFRVGLNDIKSFDENDKAIENRNWKFVWANQFEPSTKAQPAYNCYCTRFGKEHTSNIDIQEEVAHLDEDADYIPNHSLLVGGFPCQDYSVARSLSGEKGIEGKKGVLFWSIAKILHVKKPPFVLLENVDRLLKSPSKQRGRDFGIMLRTFNDEGYDVEWRVINAAEYGARQRRRRTFIFAWRKDTKYAEAFSDMKIEDIIAKEGLFAKQFPINLIDTPIRTYDVTSYEDTVEMTEKFHANFENTGCMVNGQVVTFKTEPQFKEPIPLKDTLLHNVDKKFYLNDKQKEKFEYLKGSKRITRTNAEGFTYNFSEGKIAYPENIDLPSRTMLTSEGTVNRSSHVVADLDTGEKRIITPVEAERLQHFPDNWTNTGMTDRQRYFMMGNALVTFIINTLEPRLEEIIKAE